MFDEIYGNEILKNMLARDIECGTLAHAYIVEGPKGSGRHTLVRGVLTALAHGGDGGKIERLICPDVIYIERKEGKKSISVDAVRELRDEAYLSSNDLDFKAFVISEAHLMTVEAQNAFLKILEEPPENVYFFLITNGGALLPTVRSRAPVLRMQTFSEDELIEYSTQLSASVRELREKNGKALSFLAKNSGGAIGAVLDGVRDDSMSGYESVMEFIDILGSRDKAALYLFESKIPEEKEEYSAFLDHLISAFRDIIAVKQGIHEPLLFFLSYEDAEEYCFQFSFGEAMNKIRTLLAVKEETEYNLNGKTARLDMLCRLNNGE